MTDWLASLLCRIRIHRWTFEYPCLCSGCDRIHTVCSTCGVYLGPLVCD